MSNDLEHRQSPPDFGDDDKDDDQMFKSARLPATDDVRLSEDDDDDENPFQDVTEKIKTPSIDTPVPEPEVQTPVEEESQLFSPDIGANSTEVKSSITQPVHSLESQPSTSKSLTSDISHVTTDLKGGIKRSKEYNIEITVSDPTKVGEVR
jgi:hypothetical protein